MRQGYAKRDLENVRKYGWDQAPRVFETIWIDPNKVSKGLRPWYKRSQSASVVPGDWDLDTKDLGKNFKIVACHKHFCEGLDWQETGVFDYMLQRIEKNGVFDECKTYEDIIRRYQSIDQLYERLSADGRLKTQAELKEAKATREKGGVHVHVGRDGELIFGGGGCHRLAIAQLLGMKKIPAQLGVVHPDAVHAGVMPQLRNKSH